MDQGRITNQLRAIHVDKSAEPDAKTRCSLLQRLS
jgi:hypothetical protein